MVDVQQTCFDIRKGCVRMLDVQETHFDIRKGCVMRLSVRYTHFHNWRGCVKMVDILETHFDCRKSCEDCRGFVHAFVHLEWFLEDGTHMVHTF